MKFLLLLLITVYQKFLSPLLKQLPGVQVSCRYPVTCSAYAKQSVEEYGARKGLILAIKRLLNCQPLVNPYNEIRNY